MLEKHDYRTFHGNVIVECCRESLTDCPYLYLDNWEDKDNNEYRIIKRCLSIPCSYLFEQKLHRLTTELQILNTNKV